MSLLDDLRNAAHTVDSQFQPSVNEVQGVLAALVHYAEKGDEFLKAAEKGVQDVSDLLAPPPPPAEPAATDPTAPAGAAPDDQSTDDALRAQISDLEAQLAARQATSQQTVVEHQAGASDVPPPVEPAA